MANRTTTLGNVLVAAGAIVAAGTVTAIATGYEIVLTPEMIRLLIYKGFGAMAVGLMVVGTLIARRGRKQEEEAGMKSSDPTLNGSGSNRELTHGRTEIVDLSRGREKTVRRWRSP